LPEGHAADSTDVGWQDRDWAKWTDEERARFVGGGTGGPSKSGSIAPGAFLAVIVSLVATVAFLHHPITLRDRANRPSVVYGSGFMQLQDGERVTCTAMSRDGAGATRCMTWTILQNGQRPAPAMPLQPGTTCTAIVVDQRAGRWTCPSATT
jgi:hypothetical protein